MALKALSVTVLAALLCGTPPQPAGLSSQDRQRLVAHLQMTSGWLIDEVAGLTPAQFHFRRSPGAWTIAEVLEHVVLVAEVYWQDLQAALKGEPGKEKTRMADADVLWYGIDRSHKEEAIPGERPSGKIRDIKEALGLYRQRHDRLLEYVKTTNDDLRRWFVPRQGCDAYQWPLLISTHEQRHILQIREIKADPGYPKQ